MHFAGVILTPIARDVHCLFVGITAGVLGVIVHTVGTVALIMDLGRPLSLRLFRLVINMENVFVLQ